MKLSALAAQIKSCGHCEVINNGGRIFVGTGSAFYCMDGYPRTQDAGELGAMLGIPQKKMHDDLQDVIAQETAEKAAQVENKQE